jgi:hypothetical protein
MAKEVTNTEHFELGNNQVMVTHLDDSFQPAKGTTRDQHLDSMYSDIRGPQLNQFPLAELVSEVKVTGKYPLPKEFIAIIQNA